ncbi:unnamed protein product [Clonostachys rosea f. rosea IK726]|uniref:Uncharacterized protein n=1 Tax=Clonostachys rosea f. rosea IK726 TaxID=1349383 RepID=A0ACA9UUB7_BIOOC|nr:unnamed protein product [Clonostachys rosea f. rosea IK726]
MDEATNLDWLGDNFEIDFRTPELPFDSPAANPRPSPIATQEAGRTEPPSGEHDLPLLRLSGWERDKQYDKANPECIHYDFKWKVSQRDNIRARQIFADSDPDVVLAPSDVWQVDLKARLEGLLDDKGKFPGSNYTCDETNITISIERSRQRGLTKRFNKLEIDWNMVDNHLEGLSNLFSKGRKITFFMEFIYKEVATETAAKGKKKSKSATDSQKAQRAADAGLWTRVYKNYRCRGKHCKQGPHCWPDNQGNHHRMLPTHLEDIYKHIKAGMKDGENEDEVEVNIEIPPKILQDIMDNSRKRKADSSIDCRLPKSITSIHCGHSSEEDIVGDRKDNLEEYCNWTLSQVTSDRWRRGLEAANQFAMDQFLELNSILQHQNFTIQLMVKGGIKPGIALQEREV